MFRTLIRAFVVNTPGVTGPVWMSEPGIGLGMFTLSVRVEPLKSMTMSRVPLQSKLKKMIADSPSTPSLYALVGSSFVIAAAGAMSVATKDTLTGTLEHGPGLPADA